MKIDIEILMGLHFFLYLYLKKGSLPNGRSGLGVGPQEEFYNCADVAIRREGDANINNMDDYGSHVTFELLPTPKPDRKSVV